VQALNACVAGDVAAADAQLALLGCKWRLSQAVWAAAAAAGLKDPDAHTAQQQQQQSHDAGGSSVLLHDAPLPPAVLHALQQAFHSSSSDFWSRHAYGDDATPFFSYVVNLQAAAAAGPSNALEAAALLLQQQLKQMSLHPDSQQHVTSTAAAAAAAAAGAGAAAASHVEWWAHTRPACAPHQLHFDAAEGGFRRGMAAFRLAHPAASSVLYLTGAGGPTLVLGQTTAGAVTQTEQRDAQQQQQQQQSQSQVVVQQQPLEAGAVPTVPAPAGAPAAKRPKRSQQTAEEAATYAAAADGHGHHAHKQHHHHNNHQQDRSHQSAREQQQLQPPLASHAWLVAPAVGRFALWPGSLLHGVLPGAVMPLDDEPDDADWEEDAGQPSLQQQQQHSQGPQGEAGSDGRGSKDRGAAAGPGGAAADAARTTLILAWWSCDPRSLVAQQQQQQLQQQEAAEAADAVQGVPAAAAELPAGDSIAPAASRLGPCMTMPVLESTADSCDAEPVWLQALADVPPADLAAVTHAVAASAGATGVDAGWRLLRAGCPAWEQVQPQAAEAAAGATPTAAAGAGAADQHCAATAAGHHCGLPRDLLCHPFLSRAALPCLRFFLRSSRDIRAAYIPGLEAWQQPAAHGDT
jgi:hypothetical protein